MIDGQRTETEEAIQFWLETLQLVIEHQGNPQRIYPIWEKQQAQFTPGRLTIFPIAVLQLLIGDRQWKVSIATVLVGFGDLIQRFPLGDRWLNIELSIVAYSNALTVNWLRVLFKSDAKF